VIIELGLWLDHSPEINHLPAGGGFVEGQPKWRARPKRDFGLGAGGRATRRFRVAVRQRPGTLAAAPDYGAARSFVDFEKRMLTFL
jgi:hypothetical protein